MCIRDRDITTGGSNVTIGYIAGYSLTTGEKNILIGAEAARNMIGGNFNTV